MKRVLIISIVLMWVLSIFISGCGFFESDEGINAAVRAGDPNMCAELDEKDNKGRIDKCYDRVAQKLDDPEVCDRIGKSDLRDDCVGDIAVSTRDGELCDTIGGSSERDECYHDVSDRTNDIELCDKITGDLKGDCIANVAANTGDTDACEGIADINAKDDCIGSVASNTRDMSKCEGIEDSDRKIACQTQIAVASGDEDECDKIDRPSAREACMDQINYDVDTDNSCESEYDCPIDKVCINSYCTLPECTEDTSYCVGDKREFCHKGVMQVETCIYGCEAADCLTKQERAEKDKEEEKANSCEEGYKVCLSDTRLEYCKDGQKKEGMCEHGCKKNACQKEAGVDLSGTIADMKDKQQFTEIVSGPYMDALQHAIDNEKDPSKLAGLEAYREFLGKSAEQYGDVVSKLEDLEKIKRIFIDQYDPSMDIENMDVGDMFEQGLGGRLADAVANLWPFGGKPSVEQEEQATAEQQLQVYKNMLERQQEIEFLKKSRLNRIGSTVYDMAKEKATEELKDRATDLAEAAGGTAFATVGILGDALETVQDEAQNMMFTGLIKAYDRRRAVLEDKYPLKSNEEIHKLTVEDVEEFPYADAKTGVIIAKYGNLLANKDCREDDSNPLCVDRHTFWVSMDKSYQHFNDKKMYDRWLEQMKADE